MSEYKNFSEDFILRTQDILKNYRGKYEVTNLINNCLGLIIIPNETNKTAIEDYIFTNEDLRYGINKINIKFEIDNNYSLSNIIRHIRNGIAHGRILQLTKDGNISALQIHDKFDDNSEMNFLIELTILELQEFAINFSNKFLGIKN